MALGPPNSEMNSYLRVASLSIALYDYLLTLPAEWRFYSSQSGIMSLSIACVLFILIRYSSILILFVSNYGYFATTFTPESCHKFYMVAPVLKVIQTMVSQAILGFRTVNIARRKTWVKWVVITVFTIITIVEWFTNLFHRDSISINGNCSAGNSGTHLSAWIYYLLSMLYDLTTLSISTFFLFKLNIRDKRFSRLPKIMLYDGLGYFVALTASNIFNLIVYRTSNQALQSSGASLGFTIVWIMSQRILIHLRELANVSNHIAESIVIARNVQSVKEAAKASRPPADSKANTTGADLELAVQVHVEHTRTVAYDFMDDDQDQKASIAWDLDHE